MKRKSEIQRWELNGSANYGGAETLTINAAPEALMEILQFMESNEPAGIPDSTRQQANAWLAVCSALNEASPGWQKNNDHDGAKNRAVAAIKALGAPKPGPKPKPLAFDLEAAKAGAQLVTRDGRKARFVAHIPEANIGHRFVAFIDGNAGSRSFFESGSYYPAGKDAMDLFMAPKPKKTVWVNFYKDTRPYAHDSETKARDNAGDSCTAIAVPVEIDA